MGGGVGKQEEDGTGGGGEGEGAEGSVEGVEVGVRGRGFFGEARGEEDGDVVFLGEFGKGVKDGAGVGGGI